MGAMLWDLNEGKHLYTLDGGGIINALCFSPNRYWLCAATGPSIKIWDLEGKVVVDELRQEVIGTSNKAEPPQCICLAWRWAGTVRWIYGQPHPCVASVHGNKIDRKIE